MRTCDLFEGTEFNERNAHAESLNSNEEGRALCFAFLPGQRIEPHESPHSPVHLIILQGRGMFAGADGSMMGQQAQDVGRRTVFKTLAPPDGYLYTGPSGSGHFVKMAHNGIEYGMLQAYGEGFEILKSSDFDALDLHAISHLWNQGSVLRSWLLELAERAFEKDPALASIRGYVEDSGEGRWTVLESIEKNVPAPVLVLSLMMRFRSRQDDSFGAKVIAALRNEFGGHAVKPAE
jgi:6-phosphogluconate dehydrogenase